MKVVEVIQSLATDCSACERLTAFTHQFGHTLVNVQDTSCFLVNHLGRAYSIGALRIVQENVTDFATVWPHSA